MIRHMASVAEIVEDVGAAVEFYRDVLGLTVEHEAGTGYALVKVPGTLHFGLWSRQAAAESTYGDAGDADKVSLGFTVGFEVDDLDADTASLCQRGLAFVQEPKTEPWNQKTSRFYIPGLRASIEAVPKMPLPAAMAAELGGEDESA